MRHSVIPTLPHLRESCFSRNSASKSDGQMMTPAISSVCGGSYPSAMQNSVIWSTCLNLRVPDSSFGCFLGSAACCWTSYCHRDQPVQVHVQFSIGLHYHLAYYLNTPSLVNKAERLVRNLQGIYRVQFWFYFAITTSLRATEHLASLRFTHTVPVSWSKFKPSTNQSITYLGMNPGPRFIQFKFHTRPIPRSFSLPGFWFQENHTNKKPQMLW